jgi:circadian clock protein KaiC
MPASHNLNLVPTGIEGLDFIFKGGLVQGEVYIVQGPPGGGKTILGNQICFNHTAQGGKALYVGLLSESYDRMLGFVEKMTFFNQAAVGKEITYISGFAALKDEGLPSLARVIAEEIKRKNISFVVVDGLFVVSAHAKNEQEFTEFVRNLQAYAPLMNCTMLLMTNDSISPAAPELAMVDGWMRLKDEVHDLCAIRSITIQKQRGSDFLEGQHNFRITNEGIKIFPRLEMITQNNVPQSETLDRVSSGVDSLDTMMHGGIPRGSIAVAYGPSGSGKTTLGLQFLSLCTAEEPGLYFGFYETPARLLVKAESIGIDLREMVRNKSIEIIWHRPSEGYADEFAHELLHNINKRKVERLFIDGIQIFEQAQIFKERYLDFMNVLSNELRLKEVTSLYGMENMQLLRPDNMGSKDLSAIVDNVILLHYGIRKNILRRKLSILKVRDSDFDPISEEFYITNNGIQFGSQPIHIRPEGAVLMRDVIGREATAPRGNSN